MQTEIWKDVVGYEGYYQVSSIGNVRSMCRMHLNKKTFEVIKIFRIFNLKKTKSKGYPMVKLYVNGNKKSIAVHKLVAQAFIPNQKNLQEVNHKNAIKDDNRIENLEWTTHSENMIHAKNNNLITYKRGLLHHNSKPVYQYDVLFLLVKEYVNLECVMEFGFNPNRVSLACKSGNLHKGYIWSFNKI